MSAPKLEPHVIETPGPTRGSAELRRWAAKHPCACGHADVESLRYRVGNLPDGRVLAQLHGTCPSCGRPRRITSWLLRDEMPPLMDFHLEPFAEPSRLIGPHEFLAIVLRADLDADPDMIDVPTLDEQYPLNARALEGINELAKFLPDGADEIPDAAYQGDGWPAARAEQPECYTRAWIERTRARLVEQRARYEANGNRGTPDVPPPPPKLRPFSREALEAHRLWTEKGGRGLGQRLTVADFDATGLELDAQRLSGLIADHVTFDKADFSFGDLDAAEWTGCTAREAAFGSTRVAGATLVRCNFERAIMGLTKLGDSKIVLCNFDGAYLDRSTWYRANVRESSFRGVQFGNAAFDKAIFTDCDFRGADFSLVTEDLLGTIFDALFLRCDLRDTKWRGRSLHRGRFIDCNFGGSSGPPSDVTEVQIENPDLTSEGNGPPGLTRDDLCRYWKMDMAKVQADDDRIRAYWRERFIKDRMDPDDPYHAARLENFVKHPASYDPDFDIEPVTEWVDDE